MFFRVHSNFIWFKTLYFFSSPDCSSSDLYRNHIIPCCWNSIYPKGLNTTTLVCSPDGLHRELTIMAWRVIKPRKPRLSQFWLLTVSLHVHTSHHRWPFPWLIAIHLASLNWKVISSRKPLTPQLWQRGIIHLRSPVLIVAGITLY